MYSDRNVDWVEDNKEIYVDAEFEVLGPILTPQEIQAAIEKAKGAERTRLFARFQFVRVDPRVNQ